MEYFPEDQQRKKTIVSMAILLEPSEYNLVDIDSTWGRLAVNEKRFGTFGEFDQEDFVTSGKFSSVEMNGHKTIKIYKNPFLSTFLEMRLVPSYFQPFLIAKTPRSSHKLDVSGYLLDICVPAFSGMFMLILLVMVCAWEGWFCRTVIEEEEGCCCVPLSKV